jgi:predicted CXXCH cytochrome family protein
VANRKYSCARAASGHEGRDATRHALFFWATAIALAALLLAAHAGAADSKKGPTDADCLACHGDPSAKRDKGGSVAVNARRLAASVHGQASVGCVDCHADLAKTSDFPHAAKLKPVDCASCHTDAAKSHPFHPDLERAANSKQPPNVGCADCHGGHEIAPVKDAGFRFAPPKDVEACGTCHDDIQKHFLGSEHGRPASGAARPPTCLTCHRQPVTDGPDPVRLKMAQQQLCLSCHLRKPAVRNQVAMTATFIASYEQSVHGQALARGDARAPTCVDCHGAHDERKGFDTASFVNKMRVQEVCGRCHENESRQFAASVHGAALKKGNADAPACTSCHGEHAILAPKDPRSPVAAANVSTRTCTPCHSSLRVTEKWNLPRDRSQTFADSYHGLASRGGVIEVANCASCHGAHDILPSSNPTSRIAAGNLARTCGAEGCHPGANARFGSGKVHVVATAKEQPLLFWIGTIYIVLIVGVIGGMLLHNLLDFARKSRRQMQIRRGEISESPAGKAVYVRMTLGERVQHMALMSSFILLVITGFMLRYPDAWWVVGIRKLSSRTFELRSVIHRVAALVMVAASLYHVAYIAFTRRGRQFLRDMWWRLRDFRDPITALRYNLGLSGERPKFDRFSYVEKAEYWALVWGTIVMVVTGFIMWFDNTFIGLLTKLGYDVSRSIHFYEAWLASLAILVWHIYFVIFNPDVYPMNMAWLKGTLSEREMEEEHPLELERLHAQRKPGGEAPEPGTA